MAIIKKFRIKSFKNVNSVIEFENVSIAYGNRLILDNINFYSCFYFPFFSRNQWYTVGVATVFRNARLVGANSIFRRVVFWKPPIRVPYRWKSETSQLFSIEEKIIAVSEGIGEDLIRNFNLPEKTVKVIENAVFSKNIIDIIYRFTRISIYFFCLYC